MESAAKTDRLLSEERRRKILEVLDRQDQVTVSDLVERFGISAVTARADLDALAAMGALVRSHGGAVKPATPAPDYPLDFKENLHRGEKRRIGKAAAQLIEPGETVIMDSGTTTVEVARALKALPTRPVTVITNALNVAYELGNAAQVPVIMLGGMLRPNSYCLVGPQAENTLRDLNADHLFLGVDGLNPEVGPSTPDILEAQLNAMMIRVARQVTVVADSTKFRKRSLCAIARMEAIHRIITDDGVPPAILSMLKARGVEVLAV